MKDFLSLSDEELLAQCTIETMRSSGKGGQHVNKTDSAIRITHTPTKISVKAQQSRSQHRNKIIALDILRKKLEKLFHIDKPRIKTKMSKVCRERNLQKKKKHSQKKKERSKKNFE